MSSQQQRIVPTLAVLGCLAIAPPGEAAQNRWSSQGPFGGSVKALVVDPNDSQVVYAGIDGAGVFKTTDGGTVWTEVGGDVGDPFPDELDRVQALAFDNQVPANLYVGTNGDGVFRYVPGADLWTQVNGDSDGDPANDLQNLAVISLAVHPDKEFLPLSAPAGDGLIFAGTNGGGVFRGTYDDPLPGDVAWDDENAGLGNRVIFDLEIPQPQSRLVINEVDAKNAGDTAEFIELFGPANRPLGGLVLVLYDAGLAHVPTPEVPCPLPSPPAMPLDDEFAYAAYDLDGFALDNTGFFVIGDVGVPNVDFVPGGFDILNTGGVHDSAAVALYFGDATDFSFGAAGTNPTTDQLIDVLPYQTGGGTNDVCFMAQFGLGAETQASEAGGGGADSNSIQRLPDGGLRSDPDRFGAVSPPTAGLRNVPLSTLYAATDLEGVYRTTDLFAEPNLAWAPINNGLTSDVVFSLGVDPVDPNVSCGLSSYRIYAGTSGQGVFRSTDPCDLDLEEDWQQVSNGRPPNTTVTAMAVAPVIDPLSPFESAIYAGTEFGEIYKSTDEGNTWSLRSNGLGGLRVDSMVVEPTIYGAEDPERPSRIYAGTLGGGVYKTIDSGSNWFLTTFDLSGIIGVFVEDVEIVQEAPFATLYAATFGGGVWRSEDNGDSWISLPTVAPPPGFELGSSFVNTLALDPGDPLRIYAGTDLAGGFESADGGETWSPFPAPIDVESSILELVLDPGDTMTLYAATGDLYRSTDAGATWTELVNAGADPDNFNDSAVQTVTVDPSDSTVVFVGTQERGLFRSDDADAAMPTWSRVGQASLTESFIRAVVVDPETPATIYAGTDGGGVFKSVDGGNVWVPKNNGLPDGLIVLSLKIDLEDTQILYAGTDGDDPVGGGVFKTLDGGANWAPFNTNLTNFVIKDFEIAPRIDVVADPQFLHAASFGGGVFDFEKEELFIIDPQTGLVTTEAGGTDSFSISLARIPTDNVTFQLESSDLTEGTVAPTALLFTPQTASDPQFVVVTGVPDDDPIDGDVPYSIILKPVVSEDPSFDGVDPDDVSVVNLNVIPPEPGVIVLPSGGLETTEDGGTATFDVILRSTPSAQVDISLVSNDPGEGTVDPAVLSFSPVNADIPQTATITGVQDGVPDGDQAYLIITEATSADPEYNGIAVPDVSVTNRDNGLAGLFETALLGPTGQPPTGGWVISDRVYLGAKFTVSELITVRKIGGHVVAEGADGTIFLAVVPLALDDFPPDFTVADDAVFATGVVAPVTSAEVSVSVDFELDPGRYGVIFGSGELGATGRARMPGNDTDIGSPEYFFSDHLVPVWENSDGPEDLANARFFMNGFVGRAPDIFADGFESGDTSAWSLTMP